MKNILIFIESLAGGGAEKILTDIVTNIDKNRFCITVCTVSDNGIYQKQIEENAHYFSLLHRRDYDAGGIKKIIYWLKTKLIYMAPISFVYRCFIKNKYDVEVAFIEGFATKFISGSGNKKSKKIAWVHTDVLENPYADSQFKSKEAQINVYQIYDHIICVSKDVAHKFVRKLGGFENIHVIYNPIDCQKIYVKSKESIEFIPNKTLQMISVGRLSQEKGYLRLLEAINKCKNEHDFSLWIVGDGNKKEEIDQYIKRNNLIDKVQLIGFKDNPYKYISKSDVFICSSYAEGYSTAATEAIILNKPIFTVKCSGMEELFAGYKCGEIVENTDGDLYEMVYSLLSGSITLTDYQDDVRLRAQQIQLGSNISEIEKLLDE